MQSDPLVWQLLLQLFLILLNAVFACAEIAVISMNDAKLARMAADGDRRAVRLARLTSQPAKFLATIQVAITLSGFLGSAFAADNFSERIVAALTRAGTTIPAATLDALCVILITLVLSYFTLVLGELVPKRIAMKNAEGLALGLSGLIALISRLFAPLVLLLTVSTNAILRLFHMNPDDEDSAVTEEEIRMMVDVGSEKGTIDQEEKTLIQNVFEFDDVSAGEIATHRTQVVMLWMEDDDDAWSAAIHASRHSFYPVCENSADNVVGILDAKDYFRLSNRTRASVMANAVSPAYFVPESVKADVLFSNMKKRRRRFAVVLDEYGGVAGILTINDLVEEIVGAFADDDEPACLLEQVDARTWRMSGSVPLDAITDTLHVELPNDEFETLGGLVFSTQSVVPQDGARFCCSVAGLEIDVLRVENHRVAEALVRVSALPKPAAGEKTGAAAKDDEEICRSSRTAR